jgi:hypothetical protein
MIERVGTMLWVEDKHEWHFVDEKGNTVQEFFDCPSISGYFEDLDKSNPGVYDITITKREV